jgi:hypothetical protein
VSARPAFDRTDRRKPDELTFPRLQALRSANTNAPCKLVGSGPISCQVENHTSQVQTCHQSSLSRRSRSSEYSWRYTSVRRSDFLVMSPTMNIISGATKALRTLQGSDSISGRDMIWVGIDLWGPPIDGSAAKKNVLGFATYSQKSRIGMTAAALARDAGGIALYHDGRVFTRDGRARPRGTEPMTEINGRSNRCVRNRRFG